MLVGHRCINVTRIPPIPFIDFGSHRWVSLSSLIAEDPVVQLGINESLISPSVESFQCGQENIERKKKE